VYRLSSTGSVLQTYNKPTSESSFLFAMNLDPDGTTFWTAGYNSGNIYRFNISTGQQVTSSSFTAVREGCCLSGLAVFGELVVANPTTVTMTSPVDGATTTDSTPTLRASAT